MSDVLHEVLEANRAFAAEFGDRGLLKAPPVRRFTVLTCMDSRIDPAKFAGLADGDANVIRNAGGRASDDVIRALVVSSKLMGTQEWFVVHHAECGMQMITNEVLADLLSESLGPSIHDGTSWVNTDPDSGDGSPEGRFLNFLTFEDLERSVVDDVIRIRHHPLVSPKIRIYGFIYDVYTGLLREVPEASAIGAVK